MMQAVWSLQDAKNRFSTVVDGALGGVPQQVTRRGRPAVVVISAEEYERLHQLETSEAPSFAEMLLSMPQDDGEFERPSISLRDLKI